MKQAHYKVSPINLRVLTSQRNLIDRAALLSNRSRSDFMLAAACREAEQVLLDQRLFFTDSETYADFIALLEAPVDDNTALKALLKGASPWD